MSSFSVDDETRELAAAYGELRIVSLDAAEQLQQALVTRAAIDQAMGIIMGRQRCPSTEAFAVLRKQSQHANRKMYDVAVDLIAEVTGHPFVVPRPFAHREQV